MLRSLFSIVICILLLSCGGGQHEPVTKDSKVGDSTAAARDSDSVHIPRGDTMH